MPRSRRCARPGRPPRHGRRAFFAAHGITQIRWVLTDNGSCYRSRARAAALTETITKHKRTRPYAPRTNGKVERYNGTLAREWAYVRAYTSEYERRVALADFLNFYNHERPHAALKGRPPISRASGSDHRVVFGELPEVLPASHEQLVFEDVVEPTS